MTSNHDSNVALSCAEHVVAFVDLLGCSNSIRNNSIEMLNQIRDLYIAAYDMCHQGPMAENCSKLKIRIFSDNILFAYETGRQSGSTEDAFGSVCILTQYLGIFQTLALQRKLLLRGGLTIGDLYVDDVLVWGKGLLRAYELESNVAIYPRIIVDSCVIEEINKAKLSGGNKFDICKIGQDMDLAMYIDYLKCYKTKDMDLDGLIANAYNSIINVESGEVPNRIWQKIAWQINYMNKYLSFDLRKTEGEHNTQSM